MQKQREKDWDRRYLDLDTPWEDSKPFLLLEEVFSGYVRPGSRVLEVGCGLGTNASFLAGLGYVVTAIDISPRAAQLASEKYKNRNLDFLCADFLKGEVSGSFDVVFDRGCFHSFTEQESYNRFSQCVFEHLVDGGHWINISGNADHPDDLEKRRMDQFPRMSLTSIATAVEPFFEIQEIRNTPYGIDVNFLAWLGVFKKREFFYLQAGD